MPGNFGRSRLLRAGYAILLTILVAAVAVAQEAPPANPIDRWNRMPPEERERELAKLPPARARLIRQRIARYNQMRPEEQKALRDRYETFSHLPPDRQQIVRDRLREFHQLPKARQPLVHREVERLRLMPEGRRQARMNGDEFRGQFSPQEQQIIRDLTIYLAK